MVVHKLEALLVQERDAVHGGVEEDGKDGVQVDVFAELMVEGFLEHPHHIGVR